MKIEIITAIGAVVISLLGSIISYYKLRDTQRSWEHGQKISIEKELFFEKLKKRYMLYSKIFELLGNIRDIEYPTEHYESLEKNKKQLIPIANAILEELYGEVGLFMEYETRSLILKTYQMSYKYANNEVLLNELVDSYYFARRAIRKDLEFDDYNASKSMKDILKDKKTEIADSLQIEEKTFWVKKNIFAQSSRPGYPSKAVTSQILNVRVEKWKNYGIKSIICLLSHEELSQYYSNVNGGLLAYYKFRGFSVIHVPIKDFQSPIINEKDIDTIVNEYLSIDKPTLIHCGAGEDRTGLAVHEIIERL